MTAPRARWSRNFNLAAAAFVFASLCSDAHGAGPAVPRDAAKLGRGINILGYDGIWEGGQNAPFRLDNLTAIRKAGFSHVRINFFGFKFMDRGNVLDEAVLRRLDAVIEEILARNLVPIVDEHDTHVCQRDVSECGEKLRAFWRQIAERYAGRYPGLVFEVLNKPGTDDVRQLEFAPQRMYRHHPPHQPRAAGHCCRSQHGRDSHRRSALPAGDRNLIVAFHYYAPIRFTHQGAPWSETFARIGPLDWGSPDDEAKAAADFEKVSRWSEREKRPVYLGEFGVYERAPSESRQRYLSFVARSADRRGWAWAYWQFDHDFAAFDSARQAWKPDILRALIPPAR